MLLLSSGFVDVFSDNKEAVVNHGRKLLKVSSSSCLRQKISNKQTELIDHGKYFWLLTLFLMMLQHNFRFMFNFNVKQIKSFSTY